MVEILLLQDVKKYTEVTSFLQKYVKVISHDGGMTLSERGSGFNLTIKLSKDTLKLDELSSIVVDEEKIIVSSISKDGRTNSITAIYRSNNL